jgi:hypothetical protein
MRQSRWPVPGRPPGGNRVSEAGAGRRCARADGRYPGATPHRNCASGVHTSRKGIDRRGLKSLNAPGRPPRGNRASGPAQAAHAPGPMARPVRAPLCAERTALASSGSGTRGPGLPRARLKISVTRSWRVLTLWHYFLTLFQPASFGHPVRCLGRAAGKARQFIFCLIAQSSG